MKVGQGPSSDGTSAAQLEVELHQQMASQSALALVLLGGLGSWWFVKPAPHPQDILLALSLSLFLEGCLAYWFRARSQWVSRTILLLGPIAALSVALARIDSPAVPYFAALVVIINAAVDPLLGLAGAVLCSAAIWFPPLRNDSVAPSLLLLWLTLGMNWLSLRLLYTVMGWAWSGQRQAASLLHGLRARQGELNRTLVAFTEASRRLERTNEQLAVARLRAEEARRLQEQFVANISHELRTPLNLIVGFSEMMVTSPRSYGGVLLPSSYRGDAMAIYRSARHLSDLIDDVLDLSEIEAGRMVVRRDIEDLGQVVSEAAEMVRKVAEAQGLRLDLDLPDDMPPVLLDRLRIRQVVLNLLANAVRFTDTGRIRVSLRMEGQEVLVQVQDTGCGIPADKLAQAFEPFSRLGDDPNRSGTGLGLAMSKRFVELHGGRMWIDSEEGLGTSVYFTIPAPRDGRRAQALLLELGSGLRAVKEPVVLVLHDDPRVLAMLERSIDGYRFVLVETAAEANEMIETLVPEAVVIDSLWPGQREALRIPPHLSQLACPLPSLRRLAGRLGATDYLAKPISREDLAGAIERLPEPPRKVLIVDDDVHMVRLLTRMLHASNPALPVLQAFGGEEGLQVACAERPDLLLLDLVMPGMDGYRFLETARQDRALDGSQVIILSAHALDQEFVPEMSRLRLQREAGFSLAETLRALGALLPLITQPDPMPTTRGAVPPTDDSE